MVAGVYVNILTSRLCKYEDSLELPSMNCVEYGQACGVILVFVASSVCDNLETTYNQYG
jgi:hypothetical protein